MRFPWESTKPLRVEVALNPATDAPLWRDVSALVKGDGVHIVRGGGGRHEMAPPGRCSFTLDNRDGAYSDVSGIALALYRKRVRVSYRTPGVSGNLIAAESASFEGGTTGGWGNTYFAAPAPVTLANSTTRALNGTRSLLVTFPAALAGAGATVGGLNLGDLSIGRTYTAQVGVWVPAGTPAVRFGDLLGGTPTAVSTVTNAWQTLSVTFVFNGGLLLGVTSNGATTAGQQVWVDSAMTDEGSSVGAFTTTRPVISYRFTGRIATNDLTFPALGQALTTLNATDETAWQGSTFSTLRSAPAQEILSDSPAGFWTLADGDLGDISGNGGGSLELTDVGVLPNPGTPIAGSTTATGVTFAAGQYYAALLGAPAGGTFSDGLVLEAAVRTVSTTEGAIVTAASGYGPQLVISMNADGKPRARRWNVFDPGFFDADVVSTVAINDGQPHHVAAVWTASAGRLELFVDSFLRGTAFGTPGATIAADRITVGGSTHMANFSGLVAFAAITGTRLTSSRIVDHASALVTGFNQETIAGRMARYNRWAGTPFGVVMAMSTVARVGPYETEGKSITDAIDATSAVEDGMTFVRGDGQLIIRGRALFTQPTTTATIAGPGAGQANRLRDTLTYSTDPRIVVNDVTGTMPGGVTDRVISSSSIAEYGRSSATVDGPFVSQSAMGSVIDWLVSTESIPQPQADGLSVRMSQLDDAATTALLAVDLGHVVAWTNMPTQAPAASSTGVVLGIEETYTQSDLLWTASLAPNYGAKVALADDPALGLADAGLLAAY